MVDGFSCYVQWVYSNLVRFQGNLNRSSLSVFRSISQHICIVSMHERYMLITVGRSNLQLFKLLLSLLGSRQRCLLPRRHRLIVTSHIHPFRRSERVDRVMRDYVHAPLGPDLPLGRDLNVVVLRDAPSSLHERFISRSIFPR